MSGDFSELEAKNWTIGTSELIISSKVRKYNERLPEKLRKTYKNDAHQEGRVHSVLKSTMILTVFVAFVAPVLGGVILPNESVVRGGLMVAPQTYRGYDRKLGFDGQYGKYGHEKVLPNHHAAIEHDIRHQLVMLERNLAAARPYLARNPYILHETEEQLRALQHIQADRLLLGIESIRQLELQQEALIHQVNDQLENSVKQLQHLAVLQQEISNKQKSSGRIPLPLATIEATRHLTAQLHAIEAAKAQEETAKDAMVHAITKEDVDSAIVKEVLGHGIPKEMTHHDLPEDDHTKTSGVSTDEGVFLDNTRGIDPRTSSDHQDDDDNSNEEDEPVVFEHK